MLLFRFEKMISGMYLGEIVRLVCIEMVSKGLLFGGIATDKLTEREAFLTKYVSDIERYVIKGKMKGMIMNHFDFNVSVSQKVFFCLVGI